MPYPVGQRVKEIGIRVEVESAAGLSALLHSALDLPGSPDLLFGVRFYDPVTFVDGRSHRQRGSGPPSPQGRTR